MTDEINNDIPLDDVGGILHVINELNLTWTRTLSNKNALNVKLNFLIQS